MQMEKILTRLTSVSLSLPPFLPPSLPPSLQLQGLTCALSKVCLSVISHHSWIAQLKTDNVSFHCGEVVVTHSTPLPTVVHLQTTLVD